MRVKFLIALAIASVLLFCSMGIAAAIYHLRSPDADQLTAAANNEINCFGFPDLGNVEALNSADVGLVGDVDDRSAWILRSAASAASVRPATAWRRRPLSPDRRSTSAVRF